MSDILEDRVFVDPPAEDDDWVIVDVSEHEDLLFMQDIELVLLAPQPCLLPQRVLVDRPP